MAAELKASNPKINIEILGVNKNDRSAYNSMIAPYHLPWLQDTMTNSVWALWRVTWRDVRILDSQNRLFTTYNLTENDLSIPGNRDTLKEAFLEAASYRDVDGDGISDDWEMLYFGNLLATARGDADGDSQDNFSEYAFGTNPTNANSKTSFLPTLIVTETNRYFQVSFRRRAGHALDYVLESSSDLVAWSAAPGTITIIEPFKNLCDGTGTGQTTCKLTVPIEGQSRSFLRVRAMPRGAASVAP
jgi:hypothetical protein